MIKKRRFLQNILIFFIWIVTIHFQLKYIRDNKGLFQEEFNPTIHQKLYSQSQYVMENPKSIIPDEIVYAHSAWEYLHGVDPIMLNAEQPPLGKYLIGLSELWFNNSRFTGPIFNFLTLIAMYLLANIILKSRLLSSIIVLIFSFEKLFIAQVRYSPTLDNIQVTFILFSLYFFIKAVLKKKTPYMSLVFLGLVISTKFWITGVVLYLTYLTFLVFSKNRKKIYNFLVFSPIIGIVNMVSYLPSFIFHDLSLRRYIGLQKYIYMWHSGKLQPDLFAPFDLLLFNKWHHIGTIIPSVDWQITWPVITLVSLIGIVYTIYRFKNIDLKLLFLNLYIFFYLGLLIFSDTNARYLFPLIPILYIACMWNIKRLIITAFKKTSRLAVRMN